MLKLPPLNMQAAKYAATSCYVAISVFNEVCNQSRPGQSRPSRSLHVIETDAAYRNPRFRSIPSGKLPRMGLEKENLFASETINQLQEEIIKSQDYEH